MPKNGALLVGLRPKTHVWGVLTGHGGVASCIVGVSTASKNQEAKEKPPLHGDPAPRMKHFPPLHGIDRAIMKFSSPTHTQNAQFPTIVSVLGRYFFHTGTPHDHTVLRRGDISFMQPPPGSTPGVADTGGTERTSRRRAWLRSSKVTTEPGLRKVACNSIGRSVNKV